MRVREVDLVRVVTFGAVVAVHAITSSVAALDVGGHAALALLHYTRSAFFVVMAVVLVRSAERSGRTGKLRRRLTLVGVPYLAWTAVYLAVTAARDGHLGWYAVWHGTVTGTAWYHLYFLLVTLQFYLLLPAFLALLRATRAHPWALLAVATAVTQAFVGWLHYGSGVGWYRAYYSQLLPTYLLLFVVGGVAALHLDAVVAWLQAHRRPVLAGTLVAALAVEGLYAAAVRAGIRADTAADAVQPALQLWAVALVAGLAAAATAWVDRGAPHARWVDRASDLSFGVYLVHPLWLFLLLELPGVQAPPAAVTAAVLTVAALALSLAAAELFRRTPASLPLTGRPRRRSPAPAPAPALEASR